jgi:Putative transposase.
MGRTTVEISDVIRQFEEQYIEQYDPPPFVLKTFNALKNCRTAALGGHKLRCPDCEHEQISYNSCRNRHCPKCQGLEREIWIARTADIIPTTDYFHVVFTVPDCLNPLFLSHKNEMQDILFRSAWRTIEQFAVNPNYLGAETGMISILHTWGQTLMLHPHIHCIVPSGGINYRNRWVRGKKVDNDTAFLFPVRQMALVFRGIFLSQMSLMLKKQKCTAHSVKEKLFNVYAKQPFRSVESVIEYLGRYSHKIAISNYRIISINEGTVTFSYKDYRDQGKQKTMTLSGVEFLRRFALHIQDKGYRRIRNYGIFSPAKRELLNQVRACFEQIPVSPFVRKYWKVIVLQKWSKNFCQCPKCKIGVMLIVETMNNYRPPPGNQRTVIYL